MEREAAQRELLRRYFTHFGPATVRDAAYFFGWTQTQVKALLKTVPVESFCTDSQIYYHLGSQLPGQDMPRCLFLAGFDQLMLGYEKTENSFLPREYLRSIFNLAGIVRPSILVDGTVAGSWSLMDRKLMISQFSDVDQSILTDAAESLWPELKQISFE